MSKFTVAASLGRPLTKAASKAWARVATSGAKGVPDAIKRIAASQTAKTVGGFVGGALAWELIAAGVDNLLNDPEASPTERAAANMAAHLANGPTAHPNLRAIWDTQAIGYLALCLAPFHRNGYTALRRVIATTSWDDLQAAYTMGKNSPGVLQLFAVAAAAAELLNEEDILSPDDEDAEFATSDPLTGASQP